MYPVVELEDGTRRVEIPANPGGVRMIAPNGEIGQVPPDEVAAAKEAGFKEMTDDVMSNLFNRLFIAGKFFDQKHPKIKNWRLPRGRGRW